MKNKIGRQKQSTRNVDTGNSQKEIENVTLYDVLYACVTAEVSNGG